MSALVRGSRTKFFNKMILLLKSTGIVHQVHCTTAAGIFCYLNNFILWLTEKDWFVSHEPRQRRNLKSKM